MRCILQVWSCAALVLAVLSTGCPGGGGGGGAGGGSSTGPTGQGSGEAHNYELDKLMRTKMNASYSKLVFMVFHSEGDLDFVAISDESARLSEAIATVLELQFPPMVKSDEGRSVYVDYNKTLKRDNDKFVEATARKDHDLMQTTLKKIGDTCSACHHFFRVPLKGGDFAE